MTDNQTIGLSLVESFKGFLEPKFYGHFQENISFDVECPEPISIYEQILFRPFDNLCWIYLGVSVGFCSIVWRLYESVFEIDSHWHFLFGIFGFFVGQSVNIKT